MACVRPRFPGNPRSIRHHVDDIPLTSHRSPVSRQAVWSSGLLDAGGPTRSTTMYYALAPGRHLGWHANSVEEVQFVVEGIGELELEGETEPIRSGDLLFLREGESHDIRNTGTSDLRLVAFFPEPEIEHAWPGGNRLPGRREVITTRNR